MIEAIALEKTFRLYARPSDRLRERVFRRPHHTVHHALRDVSFRVDPGQTLGIIGANGAGKSTLLKILSGVLLPDAGQVRSSGRITGLLELGTGFNLELSGQRNIENNALLLGMQPEEIVARRDEIVAFSELGQYIDEPMKTYSSGMVMRLAFSIAIHADPDTFLIDEALAVGDAHFQQKCFRAIRAFRERGGSIILVSHDLNAIKLICDDVLLLHRGERVDCGDPEQIVNLYNAIIAAQEPREYTDESAGGVRRSTEYGDGRARIGQASINGKRSGAGVFSAGETACLSLDITVEESVAELTAGILIRDRFGQDIFGTNSKLLGVQLPTDTGSFRAEFSLGMELAPGRYTLAVALHSGATHLDGCYHWRDAAATFEVAGVNGPLFSGVCRLPVDLRLS